MERIKLSDLEKWLNSPVRKPLIVWGARQGGKTYLVKELFAKRYFKDFLYIDLKKDELSRAFFSTTSDADKYITYIETRFNKKLTPDTLLIFDEVQQCHQVLSFKIFLSGSQGTSCNCNRFSCKTVNKAAGA
ncbi:AAA family ATPase [Treponema sp.]|uniref:AAA family ATPase n=1 Tax=Treponema sp. TaxID=166 RepID=UPI0025F7BE7A|nr:AAA family ATPase [Treponema sp.]